MREEVVRGMSWVQTILAKITEFFVNYSFEVIGALIILVLGFKIAQWAGQAVVRFLERRKFDVVLARFAAGTVKGLILGFAVIVALGKFGITIAPIIAAVGALAFGGSLAIQGVLSNFGSGLSLLLFRSFHVGDTITVAGVSGVVEEVKLGCTILTGIDGERITVPNRHIVGEMVHNSFAYRLVESTIGISYYDDPQRAIDVIAAVLERFPEIAKTPGAIVGIHDFGDSSITIGLRYWLPTKQYVRTSWAVNLAVFTALKAANITIPFPQRGVRVLSESASARPFTPQG